MRKGQATTGFAVLVIGLVLFTLPTLFNQSVDDFGLASTEGNGLTTEFPPWENRTSEESNILYGEDYIAIQNGSSTANYESLELTNEPDEFRLIRLEYNATLYETDSSITVNATVYNPGELDSWESQIYEFGNDSTKVDLQERLVGERLKLLIELDRQTQNDESPRLSDLKVYTRTIDNSQQSRLWQKMLKLAITGFAVVTTVMLLGN